jgi:hypothetical protein
MLVKVLRLIASPYGTFQPGQLAELPDEMAKALVTVGGAIKLDTEQRSVKPVEVAAMVQPEVTVSKRGRKRVK